MNAFQFIDDPRRASTPLLIGLVGPSGSGKTLSAIRLAVGIKAARGGRLVAIDTEAKRLLHYADDYRIDKYLAFGPPFSSARYTEALRAAAELACGGVVIVDSFSHEHEGPGGYLEFHEEEVDRMVGNSGKSRDPYNISGWILPAAHRRRLINAILQLDCSFIFCFRAKEKLKVVRGKNPEPIGWQAIGGEEFAYEMTVRCLLQPGCQGVPDWSPDAFALGVPKLGYQHTAMLPKGRQLDEEIGKALALWAKGEEPEDAAWAELYRAAEGAARQGNAALDAFLKAGNKADKAALKGFGPQLRDLAKAADKAMGPEEGPQTPPVEPEDESQEEPALVGAPSPAPANREPGEDDGDDPDVDYLGL